MHAITDRPPTEVSSQASWYRWGLVGIFLFSLGLRFWGLERFNTLVFDEVYYAKFANNYLTQTPFFDGHPPLSKYIIAIGMWIGDRLPFGRSVMNDLAGSLHTTWSYRWTAALTGAWIPLIVAGLVRAVSQNRRIALISALFVALDGLFLVESRYALNNVYLVSFGLLGQLFLVKAGSIQKLSVQGLSVQRGAVQRSAWQVWLYLAVAGTMFAASAAIKWNGLWFLFGSYGILAIAWLLRILRHDRTLEDHVLSQLGRLHPIAVGLCLGILPIFVYSVIWIPHLQLNPDATFWGLQQQILTYHQNVKSGKDVHPYCSTWDSWLWMGQPVAYFYKVGIDPKRVLSPEAISLPNGPIYAVHAMGNPALWWASTAAIGAAIIVLLQDLWRRGWAWFQGNVNRSQLSVSQLGFLGFIVINYGANLLPWVGVTRCLFIYHYMGASIFSMIALAWWCDEFWQSAKTRMWSIGLLATITISFIIWAPIYLGLPLESERYSSLMLSQKWICGANCPPPQATK
jgi:dolichyl-phosphate-mannose-protein mannosyltransferase